MYVLCVCVCVCVWFLKKGAVIGMAVTFGFSFLLTIENTYYESNWNIMSDYLIIIVILAVIVSFWCNGAYNRHSIDNNNSNANVKYNMHHIQHSHYNNNNNNNNNNNHQNVDNVSICDDYETLP